ncbi:MAG TPA: ADP-ribosylglycohydrolase family protein [Acidimicrobiales bacterium]|nr:ADP-ribosylglycohydrolase family protein [Acidimicrobiales bacterium]
MFLTTDQIRGALATCIDEAAAQGVDDGGLHDELNAVPDSFDALYAFADYLATRPLRADWPFVEPLLFEDIRAEWSPEATVDDLAAAMSAGEKAARVEAAFYGRVAGCILGKPVEVMPTAEQLKDALEPLGQWPLRGWVPEAALDKLDGLSGRWRQPQWVDTVEGRISFVAGDDDINYCVLATLLIERRGAAFTGADVQQQWQLQLSPAVTFGPERTMLLRRGAAGNNYAPVDEGDALRWPTVLNPGSELCGAFIRVDAYAWAALGRPALAAELAWRDAATTHVRTGVYSSMWIAALLAATPFVDAWDDLARLALAYVPQRSRFADVVRESIDDVASADDWWSANRALVARRPDAGHCMITQEVGTLLNTLRFAGDTGEGICLQVSQGNDTDSFGATAGSVLGLRFGTGGLDHEKWITPFNDDLRLAMVLPPERSLCAMAARAARLPERVAADL